MGTSSNLVEARTLATISDTMVVKLATFALRAMLQVPVPLSRKMGGQWGTLFPVAATLTVSARLTALTTTPSSQQTPTFRAPLPLLAISLKSMEPPVDKIQTLRLDLSRASCTQPEAS